MGFGGFDALGREGGIFFLNINDFHINEFEIFGEQVL